MLDVWATGPSKPKEVLAGDARIVLPCQFLPGYTWQTSDIKPFRGHVVIQMLPIARQASRILIPDASGTVETMRPDVGVVLAQNGTLLNPGDLVVVANEHGKWIDHAVFGSYHAETQVRVYGCATDSTKPDYNRPRNVRWDASILATMNTERIPVFHVVPGEAVQIARSGHHGYLTAVSVTASGDVVLPDPAGKGFTSVLQLEPGTYVIQNYDGFAPEVTLVGKPGLEFVDLIDTDIPLVPTGRKVLIERFQQNEQTAGGILLTAREQFRPSLGRVIEVGSRCSEASPGMTVLYMSTLTREVAGPWLKDRRFVVVEEDAILAEVA